MDILATLYITSILIGIGAILMLMAYTFRFRQFPGGRYFTAYLITCFITIFSFGLFAISNSEAQALVWARLRFLGLSFLPPLFLLFILDYTGRKLRYKPLMALLLFSIPVITQIVAWSSSIFPLLFAEWSTQDFAFLTVERARNGVIAQLAVLHGFSVTCITYYFILSGIKRNKGEQRTVLLTILVAHLISTVFTSISGFTGNVLPLSPTPLGIMMGLLIGTISIFRFRLFDLLPVAYQTVFLSLQDAVIVLNHRQEIIQWNPAAEALLSNVKVPLMFQPIQRALEQAEITPPSTLLSDSQFEWQIGGDTFDVRLSALKLTNFQSVGQLMVLRNITAYKATEVAKRESEQLYRLLADNVSDMIFLNAADSRFLYASPSCQAMSGYSDVDLLSMNPAQIAALTYPDDRHLNREYYERVARGETAATLEYRLMRKDGTHYWAELRATAIRNADGKLTHILSVVRNIDKRKQVEEALRESNQRYNALVENIPAVVYQHRMTPDGVRHFDYISPTVRKYDGLEPEDVIANPDLLYELTHPDDVPGLVAGLAQSARTLTQFVWEGRNIVHGKTVWLRLEAVPTRDSDGTLVWSGVRTDITAQKEAEIALERSQRLVERVTKTLPDLIFVFDLIQNMPVYFNRSIAELLGYSIDEIMALGADFVTKLVHPDDHLERSLIDARYQRLEDHEIMESEYRLLTRDRGYIWVNVRDTIYERAEDGKPTQVLGVMRDVTEQKLAEEQYRQLVMQLETTNQELKDFAYVISHDLRAPLRGVSSIVHWLVAQYGDQFDGGEGKELIDLLVGRVQRMEQMINGVLEYSRIGREKALRSAVDLNQMLAHIVDDIVPTDRITVHITQSLPTLHADPTRIRQVFQNLIDNAVKFMDKPHGYIYVGCQRESDHWCFSIRDTGPGIEAEHYERIFQLFQTLHPKDSFESTGVGLALTKRIVEMYHGKIWVDSAVNVGTTFYFTLPVTGS